MGYLSQFLSGAKLKATVNTAKDKLKGIEFDTIAVCGMSGMLVGAPLAMSMGKELMIIRKKGESTHSHEEIEGWGFEQRILIVDDFVSTGRTMEFVKRQINGICDNPTIAGIFLYRATGGWSQEELTRTDCVITIPFEYSG